MTSDALFSPWDSLDYEKHPYEVMTPNGPVICWPNAGKLHTIDGSGVVFRHGAMARLRCTDDTCDEECKNRRAEVTHE